MYQLNEGQVERSEVSTIPYTLIRSEEAIKSICIMLPGLGYTTQRPLFHYGTSLCLNNHVDVLHINYNFGKNGHFGTLSKEEQIHWMYEDVKSVVEEVLGGTNYDQCFLLSKSIGSIPMAMEWTHKNFIRNMIGIWLTPLLKDDNVYKTLLTTKLPSLCVIGDQDDHFIEERVTALKNNEFIRTISVPNADHSLEIQGDVSASIDAVKTVTEAVEEFIVKHKV
jgi:hypothetical protein